MRLVPPFLLAVLLLSGCFQTHTVIFLNADGSGTIEETVLIATFALNMIQEIGEDSTGAFSLVDQEKLIAREDSLGEGVTFEGVESMTDGGYQGYIAVYSFTDINQVRLKDNDEALQFGDDKEEEDDDPAQGMNGLGLENVHFSFQPGVLEIHIRREEGEGEEVDIHPDSLTAETEKIRSQMEEQGRMMRAIVGDAHISAAIEFPTAVSETNASFADSNRVTLVDIVFGSMIDVMEEDPELAARMQLAQTEAQRQAMLAEVGEQEDFRYEANNHVVVHFE